MNKNKISALKDNLKKIENAKKNVVKEKGFLDLYDLVEAKKVCAVYDENDNIIGLNGLMSNPTGLQHAKVVGGHMTVGRTEKERKADEKALMKFSKEYACKPLLRWFGAILQLIEADIRPDRVDDVCGKLYYYIAAERRVIDENGNEIVKLDKKMAKRLNIEDTLEVLADKLALALNAVDPNAHTTAPADAGDDADEDEEECDEDEDEDDYDDEDEEEDEEEDEDDED